MSLSDSVGNQVWEKAKEIQGVNPKLKRKDKCGGIIAKPAYGDHNISFSWDIEHIKPKSKNNFDAISNLQPLRWKNNSSEGDGADNPQIYCVVKK